MFPMFSMLPPFYIKLRKMFAAVWWCGRKASNRGCSNWSCIYWDNIPNPLASEWGGESVKWTLESRQTMMESLFRWIGLERCLVMFASEIATPTTQIEQVSKDNCFLLLQTGTLRCNLWRLNKDGVGLLVLITKIDDWLSMQINQVQGVSFNHNYCSRNFCQSIMCCRNCNTSINQYM